MQKIEITKAKDEYYGVRCTKKAGCVKFEDYFCNSSIRLPLGEVLFNIIEAIDVLNDIAIYGAKEEINIADKNDYKNKKLNIYFSDKKYNLTELLYEFKISITEVKRLIRIKDFIDLCLEKPEYCKTNFLLNLATGIFDTKDEFFYIFSREKSSIYRHLYLWKDIKHPFNVPTQELADFFDNQYIEFSFYYFSIYKSLSQLCILSLYEIFTLNKRICKCNMCNQYFVGSCHTKFCDRKLIYNDYQGCKVYRLYLANRKINNYDYMKLYRKVFSRLEFRTRNNKKFSDIEKYQIFKREWKILQSKQFKNQEEKYNGIIDFLNDERWN